MPSSISAPDSGQFVRLCAHKPAQPKTQISKTLRFFQPSPHKHLRAFRPQTCAALRAQIRISAHWWRAAFSAASSHTLPQGVPMSPYAQQLAHARFQAIHQLVTAMEATDDPAETRRCALAIFSAPDPCELDDEIELTDDDDANEDDDDGDGDGDTDGDEDDRDDTTLDTPSTPSPSSATAPRAAQAPGPAASPDSHAPCSTPPQPAPPIRTHSTPTGAASLDRLQPPRAIALAPPVTPAQRSKDIHPRRPEPAAAGYEIIARPAAT